MMPPRRSLDDALALDPALTKAVRFNALGRHVYFVQGSSRGLIKIGSSNDPWRRLKDLQAGCPVRLSLIGVIWEGGPFRERMLQDQFAAHRSHGEWFRPVPELLAYIAEHATDPCDPPAPTEAAS